MFAFVPSLIFFLCASTLNSGYPAAFIGFSSTKYIRYCFVVLCCITTIRFHYSRQSSITVNR
jgi:hypothetical protein